MNREVIFRGKADDGSWVYGTYHYSNDTKHHYILRREKFLVRDNEYAMHKKEVCIVLPSTVQQFSGITDKDGNRIFEGDVFKYRYELEANGEGAVNYYYDKAICEFKNGAFYIGESLVQDWISEDENYELIGNDCDNRTEWVEKN